jgi:hypothetical protein
MSAIAFSSVLVTTLVLAGLALVVVAAFWGAESHVPPPPKGDHRSKKEHGNVPGS